MVSILVVSHGGLAPELVRAAAKISGRAPAWIRALSLDWDATFEEARRETAAVIEKLAPEGELLILTDMYGGTPFNVARSFADSSTVRVLAGANLPIVLKLFCLSNSDLSVAELAASMEEKGRLSICECRPEHIEPGEPAPCDDSGGSPR